MIDNSLGMRESAGETPTLLPETRNPPPSLPRVPLSALRSPVSGLEQGWQGVCLPMREICKTLSRINFC